MENLKLLREQKNITQQQLADELGISRAMINQYENGKCLPSRKTLFKLAKYFDCSTDYLMNKTGIVDRYKKMSNETELWTAIKKEEKELLLWFSFVPDEKKAAVIEMVENEAKANPLYELASLISLLSDDEVDELSSALGAIIANR